MTIGIPKEIKLKEGRVAITPRGVAKLVKASHQVLIETGAGKISGISDKDFKKAGAKITKDLKKIWGADMVIKVKEPQEKEFKFFRPGLILFTYLHLAAFPKLTQELMKKHVISIDYATVELPDGSLPLLKPMSEVAGRLAGKVGLELLKKKTGTKKALILGGGIAGENAARVLLGRKFELIIIEKNPRRIKYLREKFKKFKNKLKIFLPEKKPLIKLVAEIDLLVGTILVTGAKAPKLVSEEMVKKMKAESVIVDVSIDQGGCVETSCPTTHENPTFEKHGVIHYCVANMPGIVPKISTFALTKTTLPYALELANKGFEKAVKQNPALAKGVNVYKGKITYQKLAESFGKEYTSLEKLL